MAPVRQVGPLAGSRRCAAGGLAVLAAGIAVAAAGGPAAAAPPVFERELEPFPMRTGSGPVPRAAHGGWQDPRPQWIDVDGDGDLDLFVGEETGKLRFYRNAGTPAVPDWILETDDYAGVHTRTFERFADVDADGDFDLLVEAPPFEITDGGAVIRRTGAFLYTNTGTRAAPVYANLSSCPGGYLTDEAGAPIPFELTAPDFVDLDGDGDRDLFAGRVSGELALYRNVGTASAPAYRLETESYGGIVLVPGSCAGTAARTASPRHGYMILSWFDLGADGRPDLFVGDEFNPNVYHLHNEGGGASPALSCVTDFLFPGPGGGQGFFSQRLLVTFGDVDADGDADALFGSGISSTTGLFFFRNDGTATAPSFVLATTDLLPELDRGRSSAPALEDRDGDGDVDLFLGSGSGQAVGHWDNTGSAPAPDFLETAAAWAVSGPGWSVPELGDIDGDGDADLLVGGSSGEVRWYRNDGGSSPGPQMTTDPDFGTASDRTFRRELDAQAVPRLLDVDADGDLDVVAGYFETSAPAASLVLFRNDGTPTRHAFVAASADFAQVGRLGQGLAPAFGDLDGNGSPDLIVGRANGTLAFLRNVGTPAHPAFVRESDRLGGIDVGAGAVPVLADVDADGDPDLVVGETGGGLNFYRNRTPAPQPPSVPALIEPAPDADVDGRARTLFRWEPSFAPGGGAEAAYELRVSADPGAPPGAWAVFPVAGREAEVRLYSHGFRFDEEIWWTVAARNGEWAAAVPEWRRAVHATVDTFHEPDPGAAVERVPPVELAIRRIFPSPSSGAVRITYETPERGRVRVTVYDVAGHRVAVLHDGPRIAGGHQETWDGRARDGARCAAGVYVVRVEQAGRVASQRFVRVP